MVDVQVENHGTIFLFYPQTDAASNWIQENVAEDFDAVSGGPLVVEHRYARAITDRMVVDGLEVE